jgi:hypothetical protein
VAEEMFSPATLVGIAAELRRSSYTDSICPNDEPPGGERSEGTELYRFFLYYYRGLF